MSPRHIPHAWSEQGHVVLDVGADLGQPLASLALRLWAQHCPRRKPSPPWPSWRQHPARSLSELPHRSCLVYQPHPLPQGPRAACPGDVGALTPPSTRASPGRHGAGTCPSLLPRPFLLFAGRLRPCCGVRALSSALPAMQPTAGSVLQRPGPSLPTAGRPRVGGSSGLSSDQGLESWGKGCMCPGDGDGLALSPAEATTAWGAGWGGAARTIGTRPMVFLCQRPGGS